MNLYVVIDTKGSGRVLGVFDARERAERVARSVPAYYRLHECQLNRIDPDVLDWADNDEQRAALRELMKNIENGG